MKKHPPGLIASTHLANRDYRDAHDDHDDRLCGGLALAFTASATI
jgi:hypothetical protein